MKPILMLLVALLTFNNFAQNTAVELIPNSTEFVLKVDLNRLSEQMPVAEASNSDFVKQLLRNYMGSDQSTVSLNDLGVDFSENAIYFAGNAAYGFNGVIVPIKDSKVFANANFSSEKASKILADGQFIEGQNLSLVHNNYFVQATITSSDEMAYVIVDSIFEANGWDIPFRWDNWDDAMWEETEEWEEEWPVEEEYYTEEEEYYEEENIIEEEDIEWVVPPVEEYDNEIMEEDAYIEEEVPDDYYYDQEYYEEDAYEDDYYLYEERYYEMVDSVVEILSAQVAENFVVQLKQNQFKFHEDANFKKAMAQPADAILYVDSKGLYEGNEFPYSVQNNPLLKGMNMFLEDTWQAGYLNFSEKGMTIDWVNHVGTEMTGVMQAMHQSKLDKNLLSYIPDNAQGFMVINANSEAAYQQFKKVYMPKLDQHEDAEMRLVSAVWSLIDELIDEEALFDMYLSNAFVSYNGIREMEIERITYDYDEETFDYEERVEKGFESMPAITFGLSTSRSYLLTKFMNALIGMNKNNDIEKIGNYYRIKDGPIPGAAFYLLVNGDVILFTNEEDVVRNHADGYSNNITSTAQGKKAKKAKMMYGSFDLRNLPKEMESMVSNPKDRKFIKALGEKAGVLSLEMTNVDKETYSSKIAYSFEGNYKSGVHYFMEVLELMMNYDDDSYEDFY